MVRGVAFGAGVLAVAVAVAVGCGGVCTANGVNPCEGIVLPTKALSDGTVTIDVGAVGMVGIHSDLLIGSNDIDGIVAVTVDGSEPALLLEEFNSGARVYRWDPKLTEPRELRLTYHEAAEPNWDPFVNVSFIEYECYERHPEALGEYCGSN